MKTAIILSVLALTISSFTAKASTSVLEKKALKESVNTTTVKEILPKNSIGEVLPLRFVDVKSIDSTTSLIDFNKETLVIVKDIQVIEKRGGKVKVLVNLLVNNVLEVKQVLEGKLKYNNWKPVFQSFLPTIDELFANGL